VLSGLLLLGGVFGYPVFSVLSLSFSGNPPGLSHYLDLFRVAAFLHILGRTFWTASVVTLLALLVGYPFAYLAATTYSRLGNFLVGVVSGSLFMSAIVRSYALLAILDRNGLVSSVMHVLGLGTMRVQLVHNAVGVVIGCLQFAIPLMVVPTYAVMRRFDQQYVSAARSLGASPFAAFCLIYLPLTSPGAIAGCTIVFITTLGYYIVPSILGGPQDMMFGQLIAIQMQTTLDWGLGTAMASILLAITLICFAFLRNVTMRLETRTYG
jgi:ABC-type spermidine/putrescine transport system permease subunit I